ncbi:MAG: helix-turn-helix domain-containing protein [Acholeplasma sp.]|nr:helix-turn-helix domain-containing protein [Acholeplasma sp.]CCY28703.1 helix-turn-helix domain protein [Acholeplasma sp. CAG:878]
MNYKDFKNKQFNNKEFKEYFEQMEFMTNISKAIVEIRIKKNLTQKQLSELINIPLQTIKLIEQADGNVSINSIIEVLNNLGLKLKISIEGV